MVQDKDVRDTQQEQEEAQPVPELPPQRVKKGPCCGARHFMSFMLFLGMANAYVMRTNMSVAIVAMVNHTALPKKDQVIVDECLKPGEKPTAAPMEKEKDGEFIWDTDIQAFILSSFFYGYCITQIPFGILAKKYGSLYFLGIGMLINSVFGLLVPVAAHHSYWTLIFVRFIQGLGEGPIVPCTHALLAKWIPPTERSRMGAFVYAGAQFGTIVSMPLSGILAHSSAEWPSIFYVFGAIGTLWSILFVVLCHESPDKHPRINPDEKNYILHELWGTAGISTPPTPWCAILKSLPFWAIMAAHMGQNYGYETLMTELPTFMRQILHFNIRSNGLLSALPYVAMWIFAIFISWIADWMLEKKHYSHGFVRRMGNAFGEYGPAAALIAASFTGCSPAATVAVLTIGVGFNGGIYCGFKINHLDISPRFAGILMAFTNCTANLAGLLAPLTAGYIIKGRPTQAAWRTVFLISAGVYIVMCTIFMVFASGKRQPWDDPAKDEEIYRKIEEKKRAKAERKAQQNALKNV